MVKRDALSWFFVLIKRKYKSKIIFLPTIDVICAWFSLSKTSGITARNVQIMISAICAFWPELKIINIKISNKSMEGLWREIGWWSLQSQKRTKYVKLLYLSENQLETFPWYVVGIFEKNTQCLILYAKYNFYRNLGKNHKIQSISSLSWVAYLNSLSRGKSLFVFLKNKYLEQLIASSFVALSSTM